MSGTGTRRKGEGPLISVYDGQSCVGFVLARGRSGFEAFRADETSLGLFPTQAAAIHSISGAAS
jgi:hypothetical protein